MTPEKHLRTPSRSERREGFSAAYAEVVATQEKLRVARAFLAQVEEEAEAADAHLMLYVAVYSTAPTSKDT
jgi:rubrerythrin